MHDAIMDVPMQGLLGHDIDLATEKSFKVNDEAGWKPWRMLRLHGYQKIYIAIRIELSPCSRAKDTHAMGTMLCSDAEDLLPLGGIQND